jgi:hypothetical protein
MNISGANSVRFVETPLTGQPVEFRVNQRVTADILKVSGDQVTMVVQGQQVIGKILEGDQALLLANQRSAQFIVKGMIDGVLQLQFVRPSFSGGLTLQNQWTILAQNLLMANSLPVSEANLSIGRALLSVGLPITPDLVANMQKALSGIANWGQSEADVGATLLSNGLPISSGILGLALQKLPSLGEAIQQIQAQLAALTKSAKPEIGTLAEKALTLLQGLSINWQAPASDLMKQLAQAVSILGKSLESQINDLLQGSDTLPDDPAALGGTLVFAYLRRALAKDGQMALAGELDRFMDNLRQMHFLNAGQSSDPTNPPWLLANLLVNAGIKDNPILHEAQLKVAYRADEEGNTIDPENNRIVLTIELEDGNYFEADLSMVERRIGAWMTVPDEGWKQLVEEELPEFQSRLEEMGYKMQFVRCEVKTSLKGASETQAKIDISA